jgi:signal transduction histidine kinase
MPGKMAETPPSPARATAAAAGAEGRRRRGIPRVGAIGTLRVLLAGLIALPLLLAVVGSYFSYRASFRDAKSDLASAAAVAEENTAKVLDTYALVAARIGDLLAGLSDAEISDREESLHAEMAKQIEDLPQVAAAWVIDGSGRALVSARVYPVDRDIDHSGREDFRALQHSDARTFIWALRARSRQSGDVEPYFTVSRRRQDSAGRFAGIIAVAVSGDYFASFYDALLGSAAPYSASLLRTDGTVLAHFPGGGPPSHPKQLELPASTLAGGAMSGIVSLGSQFGSDGSLIAYRRLALYPVFVAIGRTEASIMREWFESTIGYIAVGVAATIGFILLTMLALRRTRREQEALAQARDAIAQRASVEAQLHQAQKMEAVGLLTAGIAHDFNNLLTIVAGNIALLQTGVGQMDPRPRKFIAAASSACDRAAALTNRLLGFARRDPADPQPTNVNDVISGLSDLPWRTMGDRLETGFRLAPALWPVLVDRYELENVLVNLAINARDAMPGGGRLRIETRNHRFEDRDAAETASGPAGDYVAIAVADTGCGMTAEVRERAFDPFFTTKPPGKGTGLGLSQVRGFVARFGGYCTIDSEPGLGTTVSLYLPRYQGEGANFPRAAAGETDGGPPAVLAAKDGDGPAGL